MSAPKKLFVKTYGCQMNVYDSERMVEALGRSGYVETETPDDADMILLNTCHIREKAAEKIYSDLVNDATALFLQLLLLVGVLRRASPGGLNI